jgi:hypothetical protein
VLNEVDCGARIPGGLTLTVAVKVTDCPGFRGSERVKSGLSKEAAVPVRYADRHAPPGRDRGAGAARMAHWQLGQQEQAQTCYDRAVGWIEKNKRSEPEILKFRAEAAQLLGIPPTNQPSKNGK